MYTLPKNASNIVKELYNRIIKIDKNDNDFITGEMSCTDYEDDIKALIDFIDKGEHITKPNIAIFSTILSLKREGKIHKDSNPYDYIPVAPINQKQ